LKDIEVEELEFSLAGDFLTELKRKFGKRDNKLAKVAKVKKVE